MSESPQHDPRDVKFDDYATQYAELHRQSVAASGESTEYFTEYKLNCLDRWLRPAPDSPILDFGCGVGTLTSKLAQRFSSVDGFDPSKASLEHARSVAPSARFFEDTAALPDNHYSMAILSGVLHHIAPERRHDTLRTVVSKLRRGGHVVVFEHNPLNPLTRRVVAQCPFDDDAVLLWPGEARSLLVGAGLEAVKRRFIVFFPRALAKLRGLEQHLTGVPLGAQMMLVGTRSESVSP